MRHRTRLKVPYAAWIIPIGVVLALLAWAGAARAQVSDAVVEVVVSDPGGQPLPGATVTVTGRETGLTRTAVTDANGGVRIGAIPPGIYDVRFELAGFTAIVEENVTLRVGQLARLLVTLQEAATEEITVTADSPGVDIFKSDVSTNIVPEQIEQLPTQDRDFQKLAFIAPGVQRERGGFRFITGAPVIGAGGNASQSTIFVDGVDFTDQALGLARAHFSQDAIREFRVITNRFDTEIGGSAGGALSIVTKSGTNTVTGSAFGFYRGDSLRTQGKLEQGSQDFTRYQAGFTLGGPITTDVAHYFLSLEYINEDNIALFRPLGAFASQAADIKHPFNQTLFLGAIDYQAGTSQRLDVKLVGDRYREDNFRVGGVADESSGMQLNRDNWNLTAGHSWVTSDTSLNELHVQAGRKKFAEPNNSEALSEYFSFGTTLITGANIVGDQEMTGDYYGLRDAFHIYATGKGSHDIKLGGNIDRVEEDWYYPVFPRGLMFYAGDDRTLPYRYDYGVGPSGTKVATTLYGAFIQDDWRPGRDLTLSLGVRYDLDTNGNNPDFGSFGETLCLGAICSDHHPLVGKRSRDTDNIQPRAGFVWDLGGKGLTVLRGGTGKFTGRYLLVPSFVELQQNGFTGRTLFTRLNGMFFSLPPSYWLNVADPANSGYLLSPNIALLADSLEAPEAWQSSLGFSRRLGDTGLVFDLEGVYVEGKNEIVVRDVNFGGNSNPVRLNPAYTMINMYTNEGRSKYKSVIASLNGTIKGGHLLAASITWADKKNIADDFSPALVEYPSDPADIAAEWGRSQGDERLRLVVSGVFNLPWDLTVAPIYEYGSGQPWNRRLGYDYNGDGRLSDRAAGVTRNSEDGPDFKSFSLRLTKSVKFSAGALDIIIEGFNLFNNVNYNVTSVDTAEYISGPTIANPSAPYVENPHFGKYSATLAPREIQLGLRYRF